MTPISSKPGSADVIVIGGGLIGSSIALRLAQAKLQVLVLDRGEPGEEASSAAAGMIAPQSEGAELDAFFAFCAASRALYPDFVSEIEELSGQEVNYRRDGSLLVAVEEEQVAELEKRFWTQTRAGLPLERLTPAHLHGKLPGLSREIQLALGVSEDHSVDNEKLTKAVIRAGQRLGVRFHPHSPVASLRVRENRVEEIGVSSGLGEHEREVYSAACFVLAAGCWSDVLAAQAGLRLPMQPCRGQMMEFESPRELPYVVRAGMHYLVPRDGRRIVVGTTAEYVGLKKAVTAGGLRTILSGVMGFAPFLKECTFRRAWAGLRPDTADHLPVLGYGPLANLVLATGHFRNGILLAPITAQQISELILSGCTSMSLEAYRPARFG